MRYFKLISVVISAGIIFVFCGTVPAAFAADSDICMDDKWHITGLNSQDLTCTAKEVFIEEDTGGNKIISADIVNGDDCEYPGDTATVAILADIHFNADRYDIGIYSAIDGGNALNGKCGLDVLNPNAPPPAQDVDGDDCGDVKVGKDDGTFHDFPFQILKLTCEDDDRDGFLDFGVCFSWRTNGSNEECNGPDDIFPGSPSKCFCERVNINVEVPPTKLLVVKTANPKSINEPGGDVEFTVNVKNQSQFATVTLTEIADDEDNNGVDEVSLDPSDPNNCYDYVLGPNENTTCSFTRKVSGNSGDVITDKVTVNGIDSENREVTGSATEDVLIKNVPSSIEVLKTANPDKVPEPGANVDYSVVVTNTSKVDTVFISSVTDSQLDGEIGDKCNPSVSTANPAELAPGESLTCSYTNFVGGNYDKGNDSVTNIATATGFDDDSDTVQASGSASVTITDVPSSILLTKNAYRTSMPEPGGDVDFEVVLTNDSAVDSVTITSITDSLFGDISASCSPLLPANLLPGDFITCKFTKELKGNAYETHTNIVTATGQDDDGNTIKENDSADVNFTNVPPAASMIKTASKAVVTFEVSVKNDSVEELTLTSLRDDIYGDITDVEGFLHPDKTIIKTNCEVPKKIAVGGVYTCEFEAEVINDGSPQTDTVTGKVIDDDNQNQPITPSDIATVCLQDGCAPPLP